MTLTTKEKQALKAKAHALKPIISIGNQGLTDAVIKETDRALNDHELIKVKVPSQDKAAKKNLLTEICKATSAEQVQLIGNIGVIYRKNDA